MASRAAITYNDHSGEKSVFRFRIVDLTPANVAATVGLVASLQAAINPIILGTVNKQTVQYSETQPDATLPTSEVARREDKWLVRYQDVTNGKKGSAEIPTPEVATHMLGNTDKADLNNTEISAFVTAFEAVVRSVDGNAVNVLEIEAVGRDL